MKINKNMDTDQIKQYAAAAIKGMQFDISLVFRGTDPREFERFADKWAGIVTDQIPREYLEQLDNAEAIGRTIGDYTREYRKDHWADFNILVDAINDPQSNMLHMCQVQPGIIPSKVVADIEKCLFEPNIDAYKNIRKFAYEVHHKLITERNVNFNSLVPTTALEDNIHVITAFDRWLVDKAASLVDSKYVDIDMDIVPKALYNTIKELLFAFGYKRFIDEAENVYDFKKPDRVVTRVIARYFESSVDSMLEKHIKAVAEEAAESRKPYKDPRSGIAVGITKAQWEAMLSNFEWAKNIIVSKVQADYEAAYNRTVYTTDVITTEGTVELRYDNNGVLMSVTVLQIPQYSLGNALAGLAGLDNLGSSGANKGYVNR